MRRLFPLLCAAGLAVAPFPAAADRAPTVETFEWSTMTSRARLGVMVIGITPELRKHFGAAEDRGVLVGRVAPGSAAEDAGLEVGDVIVEVRGAAVDSAGDVLSALAQARPGDAVSIAVIRDGKPLTLQAKVRSPAPGPVQVPGPRSSGADARPPWVDAWFDDIQRWFQQPGWLEDMLRPWREGTPGRAGGPRTTQT